MRRSDREVKDNNKIDEIILNCNVMRLGFVDDNQAYIVPLSFGFENSNGVRTLYFHSANEGRKIELIKKGGVVSFEGDCRYQLVGGEKACDYTANFCSIMGTGTVTVIDDVQEKICGLTKLMKKHTSKSEWTFDEKLLARTFVFKLEVDQISCKEHI